MEATSDEIKPGKYEFLIKGVIRQDKNGYDLKTQKGNNYQKLALLVFNGDKNFTVFENIFGSNNVKLIVNAINNPALTHNFNSPDFELENLIGEGGWLFLGYRVHNEVKYPQVECFIKCSSAQILTASTRIFGNNKGKSCEISFNPLYEHTSVGLTQEEIDNEVPF